MSNIKPDDFRKHAAEEDFFRLAAIEIVSEQNEEFLAMDTAAIVNGWNSQTKKAR